MGTVNASPECSEASLSLLSQSGVSNSSKKDSIFCKCFRQNNIEEDYTQHESYLKWKKYMVNLLTHRFKIHAWSQLILRELYHQEQNGITHVSNRQHKLCEQLNQETLQQDIRFTLPENSNRYAFPKPHFNVRTQSAVYPLEENKQIQEEEQEQKEYLLVSQTEGDVELLSYDYIPHRTNSVIHRQSKYPNKTDEDMRKPYNKIMQGIEKQIEALTTPLHRFIIIYIEDFKQQGDLFRKQCSQKNNISEMLQSIKPKQSLIEKAYNLINDLKDFINFFAVSIYYYYDIPNLKEQSIYFTRDNLSFFAMNILFKYDDLYGTIFQSINLINEKENDLFESNQQKYRYERPGFFGVPQHLELMVDILQNEKENKPSIVQRPIDLEESDQSHESKRLEWIINNVQESFKKSYNNDSIHEEEFPYAKSIRQLELLPKVKSPLHQLKIICSITELIQYSITKFYKRHNIKIKNKLSAEDIIPITLYIIVKARVPNLGTYLKMVENFTPKNTMNSYPGYRLVTMQNCYQIMQNFQQWQKKKESLLLATVDSSDN